MAPKQLPWCMQGIPIDCVGAKPGDAEHGTELSPNALRLARLPHVLNITFVCDLEVRIDRSDRDPKSGIIGYESVCKMTDAVRKTVAQLLGWGHRPFLVGGCCSFVPAALAGARDHYNRPVGLAYVDGHIDLYTGKTSPTGEFADMPVAALLGHAPPELLGGNQILLPDHLAFLGYRDLEDARTHRSMLPADCKPAICYDAEAIQKTNADIVGRLAAETLALRPGRFWLHLDVDVLSSTIFSATDYLMDGGLNWEELVALLRPLAQSPRLIGFSLACYNPEKDPDGHCARDIVTNLATVFAP